MLLNGGLLVAMMVEVVSGLEGYASVLATAVSRTGRVVHGAQRAVAGGAASGGDGRGRAAVVGSSR